ncbi:MAG: galactokinase [Myxococcota bacterium]|nr:galactokinase [Myxococcota bacterium]
MKSERPFHSALRDGFLERFGTSPEAGGSAPGRVNLIGEHTDYSEGFVLPFAIDRETWVLAADRPRPEGAGQVRAWARDLDDEAAFDIDSATARRGDWLDYVQAVVSALAERGFSTGSVDLAVSSEVPREAGLSSSAALGVALVTALDRLRGWGLDALERARIAHRAENHFVGVGCGILDPFASALARSDFALRIDCRSQAVEPIPLDAKRAVVLVAHSGITRALARGDYRDRVDECRRAFEIATDSGQLAPQATSLRDFGRADLARLESVLEPALLARVRHVVSENERVDLVCAALKAGDYAAVGACLREGHRSLRDDFAVSTPELDALCAIADTLPGVYGSRLTGAGFGGCTIHLVEPEATETVSAELTRQFRDRFGHDPAPICVKPSQGAQAFDLIA